MKKNILVLIVIILSLPFFSYAEGLSISPAIIDLKGFPRDTFDQKIILKNDTRRKMNLYASVNNILPKEGEAVFLDPSMADISSSLANWIEISRGVIELSPGEEREIPLTVRINLSAETGTYHARIAFAEGSTRAESERFASSAPATTVNFEVRANIKERLQLKQFTTSGAFFSSFPIPFSYALENSGNQSLVPRGEIRIFDRRGKEVAAIPVNAEGGALSPDEIKKLASMWHGTGGFGRYKAFLDLEYGNNNTATLQDTVFFWLLPWKRLLVIFGALAFFIIGGTAWLYQRYEKRHNSRQSAIPQSNNQNQKRVVDLRHPR